jgi:hypothetical protein
MMRSLPTLAPLLLSACAPLLSPAPARETPVLARSHNASDVDVYLLCGDHDPRRLGLVAANGTEAYAISAAERKCVEGVNFFLVSHKLRRGYWVGPFYPGPGSQVTLVIEKYAGLSTVKLAEAW